MKLKGLIDKKPQKMKDYINKEEMKMKLLDELSKKEEFKKTMENFAKN